MKRAIFTLFTLLITASLLQGCGALLVGGAATGAAIIHDRRDAETVLADKDIQLKVLSAVEADKQLAARSRVAASSYNRVLLLSGQVETPELKRRYVDLARNIPGVKRVVDEVTVAKPTTLAEESEDAYITTKVKLALFDVKLPTFDPSRIKVVTERNVVYLLGLVTPEEASAVVEKVRYVTGVKRVVKIFEYI